MAKKPKKIAVGALEQVAKKYHNEIDTQWEGIDIHITPTISMKDMIEFVEDVAEHCFRASGDYIPQIMDYAVQDNIVRRYTNLALPTDLEKRYKILMDTEIADFICQHINQYQFKEITKSIDRKLRYMADADVKKIHNDIDDLFTAFNAMQENITNSIDRLDIAGISKLTDHLANGEFSADAVVKAVSKNIQNTDGVDA